MTVNFPSTSAPGATTITATMSVGLFASAALAGHLSVSATAKVTHSAAGARTASATVSATGAIVRRAAAALTAGATVVAPGTVIRTIAASAAPAATVAGLAVLDYVVGGTVPAVATVVGASAIDRLVAGTSPSSVSVIGSVEVTSGVSVAITVSCTVVAAGAVIIKAGGTATGHSAIGAAGAGKLMDIAGAVTAASGIAGDTLYMRDAKGVSAVHVFVIADVYVGAYLDVAGVVIARSSVHVAAATQIVSVLDVRETGGDTYLTMRPALRLPSPFAPHDLSFDLIMGLRGIDGLDVMDPPLIPGPILDDGHGHFASQPVIRLDIVVAGPTVEVAVPMAALTGVLPNPPTITLYASDQMPSLRAAFTFNGQGMNLVGATVKLLLRKDGLESLVYSGSDALLTVTDSGYGIATFDWGRALTAPGGYNGHFQILDAAGRLLVSPPLALMVEQSL